MGSEIQYLRTTPRDLLVGAHSSVCTLCSNLREGAERYAQSFIAGNEGFHSRSAVRLRGGKTHLAFAHLQAHVNAENLKGPCKNVAECC